MGYQPGLSLNTRLVLLGFLMVVLNGVLSRAKLLFRLCRRRDRSSDARCLRLPL